MAAVHWQAFNRITEVADVNGWTATVYFDSEPVLAEPAWHWSVQRFTNPDDPCDDSITTHSGQESTKKAAKRSALAKARGES